MSGFTFEELDDIDSAIMDAKNLLTNYGNREPSDSETVEFLARLQAIQDKVGEMMDSTTATTTPEVTDEA